MKNVKEMIKRSCSSLDNYKKIENTRFNQSSRVTIKSSSNTPLVSFELYQDASILKVAECNIHSPEIKVVVDDVSDAAMNGMLIRALGIYFERCQNSYIITHKGFLVAKIELNYLHKSFVVTAKDPYSYTVVQLDKDLFRAAKSTNDMEICQCLGMDTLIVKEYTSASKAHVFRSQSAMFDTTTG